MGQVGVDPLGLKDSLHLVFQDPVGFYFLMEGLMYIIVQCCCRDVPAAVERKPLMAVPMLQHEWNSCTSGGVKSHCPLQGRQCNGLTLLWDSQWGLPGPLAKKVVTGHLPLRACGVAAPQVGRAVRRLWGGKRVRLTVSSDVPLRPQPENWRTERQSVSSSLWC